MALLIERLQWLVLPMQSVLCVGADASFFHQDLNVHYPAMDITQTEGSTPAAFDMIIAHFTLPYATDLMEQFWRWRALLKPGGMLFCTHFGPDTLKEWPVSSQILPNRIDMHELGDLLLHAGFIDPVIEVDYFKTRHRIAENYLQELKSTHMLKESAVLAEDVSCQTEWYTTYEIIFSHAFSSDSMNESRSADKTIVKIPVNKIGRL